MLFRTKSQFSFTLPQGPLLAGFAARRVFAASALLPEPCGGSPATPAPCYSPSHPAHLDFPREAFPCPLSPAPAWLSLRSQHRAPGLCGLPRLPPALGAGWEANLPCQGSLQKDLQPCLRADGKGWVFSSQAHALVSWQMLLAWKPVWPEGCQHCLIAQAC